MKKLSVLILLSLSLTSCYCWEAAHKDEPKCVVAHGVVDCTKSSIMSMAAGLLPIVAQLFSSSAMNWDGLVDWVTGLGFKEGGCLLAFFENFFSNKYQATPEHAVKVKAVQDGWKDWKKKNGYDCYKFRIVVDGKEILL